MSEFHDLPPELSEFEAALSRLAPATRIDRDRLMYRLGQESALHGRRRQWGWPDGSRRQWHWPAIAAVLAVACGALGLRLALDRQPGGASVAQQQPDATATAETDKDPDETLTPLPTPATSPQRTEPGRTRIGGARRGNDELAMLDELLAELESRRGGDGIRFGETPPGPVGEASPVSNDAMPSPLLEPRPLRIGDREGWRAWLDDRGATPPENPVNRDSFNKESA